MPERRALRRLIDSLLAACLAFGCVSAAEAQSTWDYVDLGELGSNFVGPPSPLGNAVAVGKAFTSHGGFDALNYGGSGIYDLGTLDPSSSTLFVNSAGDVAGQTPGLAGNAFYYGNGQTAAIGTLGGTNSFVTGMNAGGEVIGYSDTQGDAGTHAFLYDAGSLVDLRTLGGSFSAAVAINAIGQVVGSAYTTSDAASHAFLYSGGSMRDLGTLGGDNSNAVAISANGLVAGNSYLTGDAASHAFLYAGGSLHDLGTLGGSFSTAIGINAVGQVIGNSYINGNNATHAFLYGGGSMLDLGTLGGTNSFALGVDSLGDVIGLSDIAGNKGQHAFLYSGGKMVDLDNPFSGITSFVAAGINDAMQIIGYGLTATGVTRGFVISPVPDLPGNVGMLAGLVILAAFARRRVQRSTM